MARTELSELEHAVLLAILRLGRDAYGIPILYDVCGRSERDISRATVYVALKRLEQKGLLTSRLGESTPERGGRAKRFFALTPAGRRSLRDSHAVLQRLWGDYEAILERG